MTKRYLQIGSAALLAVLLVGCTTTSPKAPPVDDLTLPVPEAAGERAYLGLADSSGRFLLQDVDAEVLFVDCFDMYCHGCHLAAKHMNELYRLVEEKGLDDRIKFVGLGLNNSPLEAATFKKKFDLLFPVFPDRSRAVADQFGRARLPSLLVICNRTPTLRLIHQHNGSLTDVESFLEHILEEMNQECPDAEADMLHPEQDCDEGVCDAPAAPEAAG